MNFSKTTLLLILLIIFVIIAGVFAFQWWQVKGELEIQIKKSESLMGQIDNLQKKIEELKLKTAKEVIIATDKREYEQGEEIEITVRNGLDRSIWYVDYIQRDLYFWEIEKFIENEWQNLEYTRDKGFRLPMEENGREVCRFPFYEMPIGHVAELKPSSELSYKWNQKICPYRMASKEPFDSVFIEKGRYRFIFKYVLDLTTARIMITPERVTEAGVKTTYSNEFIIK